MIGRESVAVGVLVATCRCLLTHDLLANRPRNIERSMDSDLFVKGEEKRGRKKGEKTRVENFTTQPNSLSDPKPKIYTALLKVSDDGVLKLGLFGYRVLAIDVYAETMCTICKMNRLDLKL